VTIPAFFLPILQQGSVWQRHKRVMTVIIANFSNIFWGSSQFAVPQKMH